MRTTPGSTASGGCFTCRNKRGHPFSCLTEEEIKIASRAHVPHHYDRGEVLFYEGNPALAVYCVDAGSVRLTRAGSRGAESVIGTRGPGDLVGFRAVFAGMPYGATATALEPSRICAIPSDAFIDLVRHHPHLALDLLRRMAIRSRLTEEQLVGRAIERVRVRIARLLLSMQIPAAEPDAVDGPPRVEFSREDMALLVGTTRETLSRTLHGFADRGIVEVSTSSVRVLDPGALRAIVES